MASYFTTQFLSGNFHWSGPVLSISRFKLSQCLFPCVSITIFTSFLSSRMDPGLSRQLPESTFSTRGTSHDWLFAPPRRSSRLSARQTLGSVLFEFTCKNISQVTQVARLDRCLESVIDKFVSEFCTRKTISPTLNNTQHFLHRVCSTSSKLRKILNVFMLLHLKSALTISHLAACSAKGLVDDPGRGRR
jgi:hypothetical protein